MAGKAGAGDVEVLLYLALLAVETCESKAMRGKLG